MWVKVDDRFPDHRKVFSAGAHLGPHSTGRVLAIWLEAMCWTNYNKTDGFLPIETVRTFKHDRHPLKVAAAMVRECRRPDGTLGPGLWVETEGGFNVHDYSDHNDREKFSRTSAARAEAGRRGGLNSGEARRQASVKQLLQQTDGKAASDRMAIVNPVPVPVPNLQVQEHRAEDVAECAKAVENEPEPDHSLLVALVKREIKAGRRFEDEADCIEHMKRVAGRAHILYDSPSIAKAIRAVEGSMNRRAS